MPSSLKRNPVQDQNHFPLGGDIGQNTPSQLEKTHYPHFLLRPTVVPTQNLHNSEINSEQTPGLNFETKSLFTFDHIYLTNLKTFCCSSPQREHAGRHLVWTRTYDLRWTNLLHIPPCDQLIDENIPVWHIIRTTESYRTFSCSSFARKDTWN